ncbi:MAG: cyclic pyranopterin monophosphate synthase MoaC [Euryarchaeota archaeon]|nr:cyclic pyranopterin monophosphate synthase MoaC [Euryarchaeota archaeon]
MTEMTAKMVDISKKPDVIRIAKAQGSIKLKKETIEKVKAGKIEKGDVFTAAKLAAISATKKTSELLFLCHPLPITNVKVDLNTAEEKITAEVEVSSIGKTGVEMEALVGVTTALLTVWDMVKQYEKDEKGQYPRTKIEDIKVVEKIKEIPHA